MKQELFSDAQLLAGLAEGNNKMIQIIYNQYHSVFTKWLITNGGNEDDANDIFQETILVLYQKSKNIDFCLTCSIGTYLFSVGKRLWYKKIHQSNKTNTVSILYDDHEEISEIYAVDEAIDELKAQEFKYEQLSDAMQKLGEPCSKLIELFYIQKKSMQEIADLLAYTNADTAKVQKYKCITRLKKIFFNQ